MNSLFQNKILQCSAMLLGLAVFMAVSSPAQAVEKAFQRVVSSGTIRCGYFLWPPYVVKDVNTGKLSGINYEIMEAIGRNLGLKIEWAAEVGVGDAATALNTGKFDVMCATVWPAPVRMRSMTLSLPAFYNAVYAYARKGDTRFDGDLSKADRKDVRISGIDGDYSHDLSREILPQATPVMLPQLASGSEILMQVASKKADIVFSDDAMVQEFLKTNPDSLQQIRNIGPVRYYGETIAVRLGEYQLKNMIDLSIIQLSNDGTIEKIVQDYRDRYGAEIYAPAPFLKK